MRKRESKILNHRLILALLLILIVILGTVMYFQTFIQKAGIRQIENPVGEKNLKIFRTSNCPRYSDEPKDSFLVTYHVKKGDTVLSIANNELGSSSRAGEIIALNQDKYGKLWRDGTFLESGWSLLLPPKEINFDVSDIPFLKDLRKTYGSIAFKGEGDDYWRIQHGREGEISVFKVDERTIIKGGGSLQLGDCVSLTGIGTKIYLIERQ